MILIFFGVNPLSISKNYRNQMLIFVINTIKYFILTEKRIFNLALFLFQTLQLHIRYFLLILIQLSWIWLIVQL